MKSASTISYSLIVALGLGAPASSGASQAHSVVVGRDATVLRSAELTVGGGDAVVEATTADNRWTGELACTAASGE